MDDDIEIVVAAEEHREAILRLIREHFVPREPLEKSLGLTWDIVESGHQRWVDKSLKVPCSVVAVHPTDGVVGLCLNAIQLLEEMLRMPTLEERLKLVPAITHPLVILYEMVTDGFMKSLIDNGHEVVMQIMDLCVAEQHAGKGIAKRLVNASFQAAAEFEPSLFYAVATNHVSELVFTKAGFKVWRSLEHRNTFDNTGRPYVIPTDGTTSITCMIKRVEKS